MFSIIIPYYKKRKYIERCINSVLQQNFKDFEIILIDDGSNDDISELINEKYPHNVKLVTQINQGVSVARNTGIRFAKNDYVSFLDADDCWSPIYLECLAKVINENQDVKIIGSKYSRYHNELVINSLKLDYKLITDYFAKQAIENTLFLTSATTVRADFFSNNSAFNSDLKRGEDIDVWLRIVASGGVIVYIENTLVYYSDEDQEQATRSIAKVEQTLVGQINDLYKPMIESSKNTDFKKFISKYVYFNLYPYYFSTENNLLARENLKKNQYHYFFLHLPYYLPFFVGRRIVNNRKFTKFLRLYFKFFLRKIYI